MKSIAFLLPWAVLFSSSPAKASDDPPALIEAVMDGDYARVRSLVSAGNPVDEKDDFGRTALAWSAWISDREQIAEFLIRSGANLNSRDNLENAPLHLAAARDNLAIIKLLLGKHAHLDLQNEALETPLAVAASSLNPESVSLLVGAHPDLEIPDTRGRTALNGVIAQRVDSSAVERKLIDRELSVVRLLIQAGSKIDRPDHDGNTALMNVFNAVVVFGGAYSEPLFRLKLGIVDQLIAAGASVDFRNARKQTPLIVAAETLSNHGGGVNGSTLLERLIRAGAEINVLDKYLNYPLELAVKYARLGGAESMISYLLQAGAKTELNYGLSAPYPNSDIIGVSLLCMDALRPEILRLILDQNTKSHINSTCYSKYEVFDQKTPLMQAYLAESANVLIEAGAELNWQTRETKTTALMLAAERAKLDVVQGLVEHGANICLKNSSGMTASELTLSEPIKDYLQGVRRRHGCVKH